MNVIDELEKIRCSFFGVSRKIKKGVVWISWRNMIASRDLGGLGVGSFREKILVYLQNGNDDF